ncbi:hypothetical protein L210DRAFT_3583522, partial [Boletus edulis BED1]
MPMTNAHRMRIERLISVCESRSTGNDPLALDHIGKPEDVAGLVSYLVLNQAHCITDQSVGVPTNSSRIRLG